MPRLTFTFDVEDPRPDSRLERRFDLGTRSILDLLDELDAQGTFFVVGTAAQSCPQLIEEIARRGHEVGLHSLDHRPLTELTEQEFHDTTREGKALLEDLIGHTVQGYRAPNFSLTPSTPWVPDILSEVGFSYSSSILPASHIFFGFAGAPTEVFRWNENLIEIPAPVTQFGPMRLPFLGGIYFRYLPLWLLNQRAAACGQTLWFYAHPYDLDWEQPYFRMKDLPHWVSLVLWLKRKGTLDRLGRFLRDSELLAPLSRRVAAGEFDAAEVYSPQV